MNTRSQYDAVVSRQNRRLLWQALLGLALAIGAMASLCAAEKPGLKLRQEPSGALLLMPDLPAGTVYDVAELSAGSDGKCWVTFAWIASGKPKAASYLLPYRLDGVAPGPTPDPRPEPGPTPKPTPDPQPLPVPDAKVTAVYYVHESADSDPKTAAVRDAKAWKDSLDGKAIRWLVSDDEALVAKLPNVTAKARTQGLPAVVIQFADGTAVAKAAPGTPEAMKAMVEGLK